MLKDENTALKLSVSKLKEDIKEMEVEKAR